MIKIFLMACVFCIAMVAASAQQSGGGEYRFPKSQCVSPEQYAHIAEQLEKSRQELESKNILPKTQSTNAVVFDFPLKQAAGFNYNSFFGISNYFDHNTGYPNIITDYNCGVRSYDTQAGYNHQGVDYFLWPFDNLMMSRGQVEIIAAETGTILYKSDGNPDQNCSFCTGCNWNAVYVIHADGSVAWYGHMKANSLTTKSVGQAVAKGEYLGLVGSSGNSTAPHLHFEVYKAMPYNNSNLIDPYAGACNTRNAQSWWASQRPYWQPTINHIQTQTAPTNFNTCPANETSNESSQFVPGQLVYFTAYYADQTIGTIATYTITRPDHSVFQTWNQTFSNTFTASWWWWSYFLPAGGPTGTWNFRVEYNGQTVNYPFTVSTATSVSDLEMQQMNLRLFPNPVNNEVTISVEELVKQPTISITNIQGQVVFIKKFNVPSKTFILNIPQLSKGNYVLILKDGDRRVAKQKFVK